MLLLPRMWSTDNIEGYINFLNYHNLLLKPEYSEEKLTDIQHNLEKLHTAKKNWILADILHLKEFENI
jgi:hypothetical protein